MNRAQRRAAKFREQQRPAPTSLADGETTIPLSAPVPVNPANVQATLAALGLDKAGLLAALYQEHPDLKKEAEAFTAVSGPLERWANHRVGAKDAAWARRLSELALDYGGAFDVFKAAIAKAKP
jgi:hypothetical protein